MAETRGERVLLEPLPHLARWKVRDVERELAGLSCFDPNYLGTLSKLNTLKRRLQLYAPQDVAA